MGRRVLVRRLPLAEASEGGIVVLGRDYPTVGRVIAANHTGFDMAHSPLVQWTIDKDYDLKLIGPDLLLLDFDQINLMIGIGGQASAIGDRVIVEPRGEFGNGTDERIILLKPHLRTRWAHGLVTSIGYLVHRGVNVDDIVLFEPKAITEIRLNQRRYWIIRDRDIVATIEEENN